MFGDIVIVHRTGGRADSDLVVWDTCQRQIVLGHLSEFQNFALLPGDEKLHERQAYQFLLEVLCGLHSKILGENEIVGQFKKRFQQTDLPLEFKARFNRLIQALLADMKKVRAKFHLNSGAHSYGSFTRKVALGAMPITVVGTGELALSILPWVLKESASVQVLFRSESGCGKIRESIRDVPSLERLCFIPLTGSIPSLVGTLVIAAPLTSSEVIQLIQKSTVEPTQVIDFRRECESDPLPTEMNGRVLPVTTLQDFFQFSKETSASGNLLRSHALEMISALTTARYEGETMQIRVGGWEDLCG